MGIRILLVDDHTLFRESLVHVLGALDHDVAVFHAGTAEEAISAASYYRELDLILLDRSLAGTDGISLIPQLKALSNGAAVVVVSASERARDVQRAMDAGAASYVPKTLGVQELLITLRRVLTQESYLPTNLLSAMIDKDDKSTPLDSFKIDKLTERQREVLQLLSQGLTNKGIANQLDLTEGTIKLHVSAIMRTLGARNRTEAVLFAEQFG